MFKVLRINFKCVVSTIQLKSHSKLMPEATRGVTVLIANGKLTPGVSLPTPVQRAPSFALT